MMRVLSLLLLTSLVTVSAFQPLKSNAGGRNLFLNRWPSSPYTSSSKKNTELHAAISSIAFAALDTFFQSSPYTAAALTCGIKASAADLVAQKRDYRKRNDDNNNTVNGSNNDDKKKTTSNKKKTDFQRNLAFLLYGAIYQGMAQEFIYNHLYPRFFGAGTGIVTVLSKVLFDLLIQTTLITLPIAYLTKALIYKYSPKEAIRRYVDDVKNHGLLKKYFMLWGPVQCITFSIIPEHYRVTFIACISFFWLIILSSIASRTTGRKPTTVIENNNNNIVGIATTATASSSSTANNSTVLSSTTTTDVIATLPKMIVETKKPEQKVEVVLECEMADGLTCNIDG